MRTMTKAVSLAIVLKRVQKRVLSATSIVENANVRQMLKATTATNANQTIGTCLTMSTGVSNVTAQTLAEMVLNAMPKMVLVNVRKIMVGLNVMNVPTVTIAIQPVMATINIANWSTKGNAHVAKHWKAQ